jgi:hypothetical protein
VVGLNLLARVKPDDRSALDRFGSRQLFPKRLADCEKNINEFLAG